MKFHGFSALLPALAAMFSSRRQISTVVLKPAPDDVSDPIFPRGFVMAPNGEYHPAKNQRKARKNRRRAFAAGNRKAFG